jgi:hypothetical protein
MKFSLAAVALSGVAASALGSPVFEAGPFEVRELSLSMELGRPEDTMGELTVYAPVTTGDLPVFFFMGGYGGAQDFELPDRNFTSTGRSLSQALPNPNPVSRYDAVLERIASHGFLVAGVSYRHAATPQGQSEKLAGTIGWMNANLEQRLQRQGLGDLDLDFDNKMAIGGHSGGARSVVQMLEDLGCNSAQALVLLSPIDGIDPFGMIDNFVIKPGTPTRAELPLLHISAGLDATPLRDDGPFPFPACAPEDLSNDRYFDAFASHSPAWSTDMTEWGHADIITPCQGGICAAYPVNPEATSDADLCPQAPDYLSSVSGQVVTFLEGIFRTDPSDCSSFAALASTDDILVEATTKTSQSAACPLPGCSWN